MTKNLLWLSVETIIWYFFFYVIIYSTQNVVSVGGIALVLVLLATFGLSASPLTRHLSIWNKVLDNIIKKEEESQKI